MQVNQEKFIEVLPGTNGRGRQPSAKWDVLAEALKEMKGQWYPVEEDVKVHRATVAKGNLSRRGKGFETAFRAGTVYARYLGE